MELLIRRQFPRVGRMPEKGVCIPIYKAGGRYEFENAYLTVEAALVLPVVMSTILFVIYMLLFQYDRCLLEQDLGAIVLWGSGQEVSDAMVLEEKIRERIAEMYQDKYVAWETTALEVSLEKNCFSVQGGGRVTFPVPRWNFWSAVSVWEAGTHYSCNRLSPVTFIRLCHGLRQFINEDKDEDEDVSMDAER